MVVLMGNRQAVIVDTMHVDRGRNAVAVAVYSMDTEHNNVRSLALAAAAAVPVRPALSVSDTRWQRMPYWVQHPVVKLFENRHSGGQCVDLWIGKGR